MSSFYEIGGQIFDGSFGYDHRKFKRFQRLAKRGELHAAVGIAVAHGLDLVKEVNKVEEIPYSDAQLWVRRKAREHRRTWRAMVSALPLPPQVKVPLYAAPEVVEAWSYGTGSYDMATPEIRRYEESVHWGGSGGMII